MLKTQPTRSAEIRSRLSHPVIVQDMTDVLAEAYELVEKELITEADFEDFVFTNPVSFYTGMNPEFFTGTEVEKAAKRGPAAHG